MKRSKETPEERKARGAKILSALKRAYPDAKMGLDHRSPFELLIATILSAQCTDERVNIVTKTLFQKYRSPQDFAGAEQAELEVDIHSTGFFRMKAKSVIGCSKAIVERHGGTVPATMEELTALPGVGRKTANVVLSEGFGTAVGVVVDTHVHRVSQRLGLTEADDPGLIEKDLMEVFPKRDWMNVGFILVIHGRRTCGARKPDCPNCPVKDLCPSAEMFMAIEAKEKNQKKRGKK